MDDYYAHLGGLTRDELRYTLRVDPKEVHGEFSSTMGKIEELINRTKKEQ